MNIFYLHEDPEQCAKEHNDKHCVKMDIEYPQMLSTAHRVLDGDEWYDKTANGRRIKRRPETLRANSTQVIGKPTIMYRWP